jgi:hypothetical protein
VEVDPVEEGSVGWDDGLLEQAANAALATVPPAISRNLRRPKVCDPDEVSSSAWGPGPDGAGSGGAGSGVRDPEMGSEATSQHVTGDHPVGSCIGPDLLAECEALRQESHAQHAPLFRAGSGPAV